MQLNRRHCRPNAIVQSTEPKEHAALNRSSKAVKRTQCTVGIGRSSEGCEGDRVRAGSLRSKLSERLEMLVHAAEVVHPHRVVEAAEYSRVRLPFVPLAVARAAPRSTVGIAVVLSDTGVGTA
jgi:hypothetical protein